MITAERIEQANAILHLYAPHVTIERRRGRLWLVCQWERTGRAPYRCEKAACLNASGNSLACRYGALSMGGTCARATANLILWIRDEPRVPISSWRYWCGDGVQLARENGEALIETLSATDYGDPLKTCCVHCKNPERRPVDWWSRKGDPTGPCCSHYGCVDWEKEQTNDAS